MIRGRRTLRLTAVAALVVLALTGFSRGHGRHHSSSSGGGGCSSSSQDHDSSSHSTSGGSSSGGSTYDGSSYGGSTYDDDPAPVPTVRHRNRSTPTSTSSGSALQDGTARLVSCASASRPYSTVEVTNPNSRQVTFTVSTTYYDDADRRIEARTAKVKVPAQGRATTKVPVGTASEVIDRVDHCEVDPAARI